MGRVSAYGTRNRVAAVAVAVVVLVAVAGGAPVLRRASAESAAATITPEIAANRSVRHTQAVAITGSAPSRRITAARLVALDRGNHEAGSQPLSSLSLNRTEGDERIAARDGALTGRAVLACLFNEPGVGFCPYPHGHVGSVLLEVDFDDGSRLRSNTLRVDYVQPQVRRYEVVAPDRIRVVFTEPVRLPQGDSAADWRVSDPDNTVVGVAGSSGGDCSYDPHDPTADPSAGADGCTRTLRLLRPLPGDAAPEVGYEPPLGRVIYDDYASNPIDRSSGTPAVSRAVDRVRPAIPSIDAVAGRTPDGESNVTANQPAASVLVGNLQAGDLVWLVVTPPSGAAVTTEPVAVSAGGRQEVALPSLPTDGTYRVAAVAADGASPPNRSNETDKATAGTDPPPERRFARYALDTAAPRLLGAVAWRSTVTVTIDGPVSGTDAAADWTIRDGAGTVHPVTSVLGTGGERTLRVEGSAPTAGSVTYAPADARRYRDAAGNAVRDTTLELNGVAAPRVIVPADQVVVAAGAYTVRGSAEAGTVVQLSADGDDDGEPDGEAASSAPVAADGSWSLPTPGLPADGPYNFVVVATSGTLRSVPADVPTIVRDRTPPSLTVTRPAGGERIAGGSTFMVTWTTCDANFGAGPVEVAYSLDGGRKYATVANARSTNGCGRDDVLEWEVPVVNTDSAVIRVTVADRAGQRTAHVTPPFTIDATAPVFDAVTVDDRTVLVRFIEATAASAPASATAQPVTGTVNPLDWTVAGQPVATIDGSSTPSSGPVTRTTLTLRIASPSIGPNDRPAVAYVPMTASREFRDAAGNPIPATARKVSARDGIVPVAPTITSPLAPTLTTSASQAVAGRTERGTLVAIEPQGGGQAVASRVVDVGDGSFSLAVPLVPDAVTELQAYAVDGAGNDSRKRGAAGVATVPPITYDATAPAVTVLFPREGDELRNSSTYTITFRAADARLASRGVNVEYSLDGGRTWARDLTPAGVEYESGTVGQVRWTTPAERTDSAVVRVVARDQAGRVGTGSSGLFGIGVPAFASPGTVAGYWLVAGDGGIFAFGDSPFYGSTGDITLRQPIVGMAATRDGNGYWMAASDGGIFAFGDARFHGSTGGLRLSEPVVGMAATPSGRGYWLVTRDGGIFAFGDARFFGSTGSIDLAPPIVGMAATRTGRGYWLVAADGGVFAFGDARFQGSTGGIRLNEPIVGMTAMPDGEGYRLVASDGGIFAFGDAPFHGSTGAIRLNRSIVGMASTPSGQGYWLVASDGGIFAFGDASFLGSTGSVRLNRPIVGMAPRLVR